MVDVQKHYYEEYVTGIDDIPVTRIEKWSKKSIEELEEQLKNTDHQLETLNTFHVKPDTTTQIGKEQKEIQKTYFMLREQLDYYIKYRKQKE